MKLHSDGVLTPPECYDAHDVLMSALSHGRDGFSRQSIQELSVSYLLLKKQES